MKKILVRLDTRLSDALSDCWFEAGARGVEEVDLHTDGTVDVVTYGDDDLAERLREATAHFERHAALALPDAAVHSPTIEEDDGSWQLTWQRALRPVKLTDTLLWCPTHAAAELEAKHSDPQRPLWFEPAACFGAGDHPTTRLAARLVERLCRAQPDLRCFDVGTGSGVLCFVALCHGASEAVGTDIEEAAITAARRNAELNELEARFVLTADPDDVAGEFDLVVANIDAPTLLQMADSLKRHVAPGGHLILTGVLTEQRDEVAPAFAELRLAAEETLDDGGHGAWVVLHYTR